MIIPLLLISLSIFSAFFYTMSAIFWFPIWRKKKSGTAHGMFLTNTALVMTVLVELLLVGDRVVLHPDYDYHWNLVSAILLGLVSVFQYALAKGYFNYKEK